MCPNVRTMQCISMWKSLKSLICALHARIDVEVVLHQVVKYGVIRKDSLCRDLNIWDTLYTAGRLQKPVLTLEADAEVATASKHNRMSALIASLLLLPKIFTEKVCCLIAFCS